MTSLNTDKSQQFRQIKSLININTCYKVYSCMKPLWSGLNQSSSFSEIIRNQIIVYKSPMTAFLRMNPYSRQGIGGVVNSKKETL